MLFTFYSNLLNLVNMIPNLQKRMKFKYKNRG
nr:MAG TPA: hypothetical protein [Bacteriophage sp.]